MVSITFSSFSFVNLKLELICYKLEMRSNELLFCYGEFRSDNWIHTTEKCSENKKEANQLFSETKLEGLSQIK